MLIRIFTKLLIHSCTDSDVLSSVGSYDKISNEVQNSQRILLRVRFIYFFLCYNMNLIMWHSYEFVMKLYLCGTV
jgi:hypothetical protein